MKFRVYQLIMALSPQLKKQNGYDVVGRSRWKENEDVGCSVVWLEVFLLLGKSVAEQ